MMRRLFAILTLIAFAMPGFAAELGDDGLHKADWMRDTFKDMREDLEEAQGEGKRLAIIFEQRGCVYCTKMHKDVFPRPEIASYISDNFFVVQINLYGDLEIADFDGEVLSEKAAARKWGVLFPHDSFHARRGRRGCDSTASCCGGHARSLWRWYHARMIQERNNGFTD